jgi:hypothetical protein
MPVVQLAWPLDGETNASPNPPNQYWVPLDNVITYDFQMSTTNSFTDTVPTPITFPQPGYGAPGPLPYQTPHYWRVRAKLTTQQYTPWSAVSTFMVGIPTMNLLAPADGADAPRPVALSWDTVPLRVNYEVQVSDTNAFTDTSPTPVLVTNANYSANVPLVKTYYWRVRTNLGSGLYTAWSAVSSFNVKSADTDVPIRTFYNTGTPTVTWGRVTWATYYEVQVFDNSTMTGTPKFGIVLAASNLSATVSPALTDGVYYWRVRAINGSTTSTWSAPEPFIVDAP